MRRPRVRLRRASLDGEAKPKAKAKPKRKSRAKPKAKPKAKVGAKTKAKAKAKLKGSGRFPRVNLAAPKLRRPSLPKDVRFRSKTRLRAIGYWLREQAWRVSRGFDRLVESRVRRLWQGRSPSTRRRIGAVAGVLLLYALVKFVALPGVPCQISAAKECAPGDATIAKVPSDALLYAHLTLDDDAAQFDRAGEVLGRLTRFPQLGQAALDLFKPPSGTAITYEDDVRPWAGDDASLAIVPSGAATASAQMISVDDRERAEEFLAAAVPPETPETAKQGDVDVNTYPSGYATAFDGDFLLLGDDAAVRALIGAGEGEAKTLEEDPVAEQVRDELPENRFADLYLSATGVQSLVAGSTSTAATQLEPFVDYDATRGVAAAAIARDDGVEIELYSDLDAKKAEANPPFFSTLDEFRPTLTDDVGSRAMGYVGIDDAGDGLAELLTRASGSEPGLAESLTAFTQRLRDEAKIDPAKDLLPALGGEAALVAEPTDGIPYASLIVDDVDEDKAREALARLQGPIARAITPGAGERLPGFTTSEIAGVEAHQLQVSPQINLTYAVFDEKLVISTDPAGIEQVRAGGENRLGTAEVFETAVDPLPNELSALVFLNLDEFLDLAEALGRVEDPLYASFRDDIRKLHSLALGVSGDAEKLRSRVFITID